MKRVESVLFGCGIGSSGWQDKFHRIVASCCRAAGEERQTNSSNSRLMKRAMLKLIERLSVFLVAAWTMIPLFAVGQSLGPDPSFNPEASSVRSSAPTP